MGCILQYVQVLIPAGSTHNPISLLELSTNTPLLLLLSVNDSSLPPFAQGLNGEILVTARTDPGWVPLYPLCSGLVIERGR